MKKLVLVVFALLEFTFIQAQERVISGTILSADDQLPLPGVGINVKGGIGGTVTDSAGNYSINIGPEAAILQFQYAGFLTKEVSIGTSNNISISLENDSKIMEEVVVVGYGTQERRDITGSISTIRARDIQQIPVTSYDQALQGRASGVLIQSPSAELGAFTRIRIRGASSVSASNDPLIVIDGIPVTSQSQSNFVDNNPSNPMADLNPNDIASVEILKDASASAIYGSRASNGVVLITTKRGNTGKTKFNINLSSGLSNPTHLRKFLNAAQYKTMFQDAAKSEAGDIIFDNQLTDTSDQSVYNTLWQNYGGGPTSGTGSYSDLDSQNNNANWNDKAYRQGSFTSADLNASGGNEKTKFYASLGFMDQKGIIIRNSFQRYSGRFNIDHQATKNLSFGLNINQNYTQNNRIPENNSFGSPTQANAISPIISLNDPATGKLNSNTYYGNPYLAMMYSKDRAHTLRNFSNVYAQYDFLKYLSFRTQWGVDLMNQSEYSWNGSEVPNTITIPSSGNYGTTMINNYTTNNTLTFKKNNVESGHNLEVLLGQSYQRSTSEFSSIQGQGLPSDNFQYLDQAAQNTSFSSSWTAFSYLSYFARANYNYKGKYLVSGSLRLDGSSRFGANKRFGYFPGISAGWVLTEEDFLKNSNLKSILPFLKVKASFGVTGNSEILDFAARGLYYSSFFGGRGGVYPRQLPNPNLTWENTQQFDLGLEYGIINNRISGGVDFYNKHTNRLLLARQVPQTSGFATFTKNLGTMTTRGWDIYINSQNLAGAFKWSTSFNISTYKNVVNNVAGQEVVPTGRNLNGLIEGQPLGVFYGVKYAGVNSETGYPMYALADGTTTDNYVTASKRENLRVLGSPQPKHYGGLSNTFSLKGLELNVLVNWIVGQKIYNSSGLYQSNNMSFGLDNQTADQFNYWRNPGDVTNVPKPTVYSENTSSPGPSSRWLYDGSFLRFRTMSLGYSIPQKWLEKSKLTQIKIMVLAQNLFTITKYPGNDPEVNYLNPSANQQAGNSQPGNLTQGIDYYSPPQSKTYTLSLNIGF